MCLVFSFVQKAKTIFIVLYSHDIETDHVSLLKFVLCFLVDLCL